MIHVDSWVALCIAFYLLVLVGMFALAFSEPRPYVDDSPRRTRHRKAVADRALRHGELPRAIARIAARARWAR